MGNRAWFAYFAMVTIMAVFLYLMFMSPFGVKSCSTNTVRCLFPDYETGVTRLGSTDATVGQEIFFGFMIIFYFIIPFIVMIAKVGYQAMRE